MTRGGRRDPGSATVMVVAVTAVAALLVSVVGLVGQVAVLRHRARGAADLAALAAAGAAEGWLPAGAGSCATASGVARANGAEMVRCRVESTHDATVLVKLAGPWSIAGGAVVRATARAGPVGS